MSANTDSGTRVAVWTAVVTAIATVLTAFIGIVPQMRHGDQQKIEDLETQIKKLSAKSSGVAYLVKGHVATKKNNTPVTDAVLVAGPASDSVALDDEGNFALSHMYKQPYCIVVQTQDGKMSRVLISPTDVETNTDELEINYSFSPEE
jgi:hypothetical protein